MMKKWYLVLLAWLVDGTQLTVPDDTGISDASHGNRKGRVEAMYDLQGRRVNPRTAGKGIYIQGRKYLKR